MASNTVPSGGYDCQFLQDPPDDLKCLICLCVARDPLQHGEEGCGKIYCKQCISKFKKSQNKCPNCRRSIVTFRDVRSERDIKSLKVKCQNTSCSWTGELGSLQEHVLTICEYKKIPCPNKCTHLIRKRRIDTKDTTEIVQVFRKDIKKHVETECEERQYTCPYCHELGKYKDITGWHEQHRCPKVTVKCHNSACKETFEREVRAQHDSICPYQIIPCKYKAIGCQSEPYRQDLEAHESSSQLHLGITMDTLLSVQKQCKKWSEECSVLRAQLNTTAKRHDRITFKIEKFSSFKVKKCYSPPFFSHPEGYKMIIEVSVNDEDQVSASVYLMRGEYDSKLEFPFRGRVTLTILNQEHNTNHLLWLENATGICGTTKVVDRDTAFFPLIMYEIGNLSHRNPDTCPNKYLVNDTVIFRVSVDVASFKPWLYCTAS